MIECPHCKRTISDKSLAYRMLKGFNIYEDTCILECPYCKKEFRTYGYDEYYQILTGE